MQELAPLREHALEGHPWRDWADANMMDRKPGAQSRWSAGKDLSWEPLRVERVCEVKYDHLQGDRFRHAAVFLRWRPDKRPEDCRYDQLEVTTPYELAKVFSSGSSGSEPAAAPPAHAAGLPAPGSRWTSGYAHVHQHVRRLQVCRRLRVRAFHRSSPASASSLRRAPDLDQRMLRRARSASTRDGRTRRLALLLLIVRRPGASPRPSASCRADSSSSASSESA